MAIHSSKAAFFAEGIEACSIPYDKPDCPICRERLQSNALVLYTAPIPQSKTATVTADTTHTVFTAASANNTEAAGSKNAITANEDEAVGIIEDHTPIKMSCCNNIFGRYCLESWLNTATSCPYCRAELFPKTGLGPEFRLEELATQLAHLLEDIDAGFARVVHAVDFALREMRQ
jgi:hypothetical protein